MTDSKLGRVHQSPSRKKLIIAAAAAIVVCVAAFIIFWLTNRGLEARIMEVFNTYGPEVSLTRGAEAAVAARAGARLHDGYGVFTGYDSICHIRLDSDSLVRMDSLSRISVNRATATTLSILVEDGQVLVDVQNQYPGHVVEIVVGSFAIGVRGTLFISGQGGVTDEIQILMLEGSVYVDDDMLVSAGYVMTLQDDTPFEAHPLSVGDLDMFAMQAVLDYRERVLEAGALTEEELTWIERLMNVPDYISIQGMQISTAYTWLYFVSPEFYGFYGPRLENVYEIVLTNEDIKQLAYMVNLTHLGLINQQISDFTPLAGHMNLTGLSQTWNRSGDISPLAELTGFTILNLHNSQISDLSPLAGLTSLTLLVLSNNQISDISPLAGLTDLTELHLYGNPITDWSPVVHIENVIGRP